MQSRHSAWDDSLVRLGAAAFACALNRTGSRMFIGGNAFFLWLIEGGKYIRVHGSFEDSCMFAQLQNSYISITVIHMYNYIYTLYIYTLYIYIHYIYIHYIYIHMHYST